MGRVKRDFQRFSVDGRTIAVRKDLPEALKEEICLTLRRELGSNNSRQKNLVAELTGSTTVFCKIRALPRLKYRLRATATAAGISQNCPAITEIINNLSMAHLDYVPRMVAYGYRRNRWGLITETAIATEFHDECVNLREYLDLHPDQRETTILAALELMARKLKDEVLHLDFWLGNVLIEKNSGKLWLIDLEYCRFKSDAALEDKLTFCLSYFYHYQLSRYLSPASYFDVVRPWLSRHIPDKTHAARILAKAEGSISKTLRRRERMAQFKTPRSARPSLGRLA